MASLTRAQRLTRSQRSLLMALPDVNGVLLGGAMLNVAQNLALKEPPLVKTNGRAYRMYLRTAAGRAAIGLSR